LQFGDVDDPFASLPGVESLSGAGADQVDGVLETKDNL
jgi:hypothetical protein